MITDNFKKSPIHDKKAIIEMMDELTPEKMIEAVEFIKALNQGQTLPIDSVIVFKNKCIRCKKETEHEIYRYCRSCYGDRAYF